MPVRYGNFGNDRTTTTKATSVRKQPGTKNANKGFSRVTRADRRSLTDILLRSRLQWVEHVGRMADVRAAEREKINRVYQAEMLEEDCQNLVSK